MTIPSDIGEFQLTELVTLQVTPPSAISLVLSVRAPVTLSVTPPAKVVSVLEGIQGPSAYAIAVSRGFVGSVNEWLASLVGPPGASSPDAVPHPFSSVASFTVAHGLPYAPATTVVAPDGSEMDTDTLHSPGQVTIIFAAPASGTLYLG